MRTTQRFYPRCHCITTYDFAADNREAAKDVWDLTVFESQCPLLQSTGEDNKQAKALKRIAGDSLQAAADRHPIEKHRGLYGLIWFIDETLLPGEKSFWPGILPTRRTTRNSAGQPLLFPVPSVPRLKHYAKVTERVLLTVEYTPGKAGRQLYELLDASSTSREKRAFPEMNQYDLALRLLGLLGSSTAAILQTIKGIVKRLQGLENAADELSQWQEIQTAAEHSQDARAGELLTVLKQGFP